MQRGDICHLQDVCHEQGRTLVKTVEGHAFYITNGDDLTTGTQVTIGPICGDWCYILVGETRYRARILK